MSTVSRGSGITRDSAIPAACDLRTDHPGCAALVATDGEDLPALQNRFGHEQWRRPAEPACRGQLLLQVAHTGCLHHASKDTEEHKSKRDHVAANHPLPMLLSRPRPTATNANPVVMIQAMASPISPA